MTDAARMAEDFGLERKPTCDVEGDRVIVRLPHDIDNMVTFTFEEIAIRAQKFDAILTVESPLPGYEGDVFSMHCTASSGSNVNAFRLMLEHYFGKEIEWTRLVPRACQMAKKAYVSATQLVDPDNIILDESWTWLVGKLLLANRLNVIFGQGESAKSYLTESIVLASSAGADWLGRPTTETRWVWLDYENPKPDAFALRRNRLMIGDTPTTPGAVHWMPGRGIPLPDLHRTVRNEMRRVGADGLVVDSLAFACGGDAREQAVATATCNVLNELGVTVLAIAHIDKAENDKFPFGSIFWHNGPHGLNWFLKRVSEEGSDEIAVGWYNRKASDGGHQRSFGVRMRFDGERGPVTFEETKLAQTEGLQHTAKLNDRIWLELRMTPKTPAQLTSALSITAPVKEDSVRKALERMLAKGAVTQVFKGGDRWYSRKVYVEGDGA